MQNENEDPWEGIRLPIVKKISPRLISDDIKSMTAEETREAMKTMFETFEKITGNKPIIVGNELPTQVLFPPENIKPTTEELEYFNNKLKETMGKDIPKKYLDSTDLGDIDKEMEKRYVERMERTIKNLKQNQ